MTRIALAILVAGGLIAGATAFAGPRLHPTASGTIDRTHRTDRLKAPALDVRVVSECRGA